MSMSRSWLRGLLVSLQFKVNESAAKKDSGDGYDPSTAALQLLFDTIEDWRVAENEQAEVDDPDREPVPPILHAWTFLFMGRSDRLIRSVNPDKISLSMLRRLADTWRLEEAFRR